VVPRVAHFAPILQEYIRPPELVAPLEPPQLPPLPSLPKFEATIAAKALGEFVRAQFGITPIFSRDGTGRGARRESSVRAEEVPDAFLATV
jgi:hypothetical protein